MQCSSNDYKGEYCYLGNVDQILAKNIEELIKLFYGNLNHDTALTWFNDYFNLIGFNVKEEKFNKEIGFDLYSLDNNDLLLFRLDSLNSMIKNNSHLFGVINNKNIGNNKWYKDKYLDFKNEIKFSEEYCEKQLNNDIMNFFYTVEEINNFKLKYMS